jgi:hypothetical protein
MRLDKSHKKPVLLLSVIVSAWFISFAVFADDWEPVVGEQALRAIYSDVVVEGPNSKGEYCADGTGLLYAWGVTFPRKWEIRDDKTVCILAKDRTTCFTFEQSSANKSVYRARNIETDDRAVFEISYKQPKKCK